MTIKRHGVSVGLERTDDDFYLTLKPVGKLTHADYQVITPMIDDALSGIKTPQVKVFVDTTEFEGWELRAAWDDLKLGLKHGNAFDKLALVGDSRWQEWMARIAGWFMTGESRYFDNADDAINWLKN